METKPMNVDVLGIGDAMVDLSTRASQLPPRGGNIWSSAVRLSPGGTTANVSANLARLGIHAGFAGCLGDDPYGRYVIEEFHKAGVDTAGVVLRDETFTGIILAVIDDEGERTFIACARGAAHSRLRIEDVQALDLTAVAVVHSSGVCLVEEPARAALLDALRLARQAGCQVYFDPNLRLEGNVFPDDLRRALWEAIALSHVVLIGDEEMRLLFADIPCAEGVERLRAAGVETVVVKQGCLGATVYSKEGECHCPAFPVPVVNTTGAGDSFDAGFIAARRRGAALREAVVYACAVAGIKVTRPGARTIPAHQETLAFLATHGEQMSLA